MWRWPGPAGIVATAALAVAALAGSAAAGPSNPAFLGINMRDLGPTGPAGATAGGPPAFPGACQVEAVTRGSGAQAAGLQPGDLLLAIGGQPVAACDSVLRTVQGHEPGDVVTIDVNRYGRRLQLSAQLVSRDEILRRRLVGQPLGATPLWGVDDERPLDLGAQRGRTLIVGLFDAARCDGCKAVFADVARWARTAPGRGVAVPIAPLAVTAGDREQLPGRVLPALDVPIALADPALFDELTIADASRIHFLVLDCRGVVQHVAPISPEADDAEAVLDELFAAAEQASRRVAR